MRTVILVTFAMLVLALAPSSASLTAPAPSPLIQVLPPLTEPMHAPVPAANRGIGPGTPIVISIPGEGTFRCTANFLWTSGGTTYLGSAGHCFLPESKKATHGPGADYDASGVRVWACVSGCNFGGASSGILNGNLVELGQVAYARQTGPGGDIGNDFGVVEVPAALLNDTRASLPVWGGPTTATPSYSGGLVCMYGAGRLVGESFATMARTGASLGANTNTWDAVIPINSGDSGAPLVRCANEGTSGVHGTAPQGIITHGLGAVVTGVPAYGLGTTIVRAQAMAREAGLELQLVVGS